MISVSNFTCLAHTVNELVTQSFGASSRLSQPMKPCKAPKSWLNFIFCDKHHLYTRSYITHICAVITGLCIGKASKFIFALGPEMSYNSPCYHQTEIKRKFSPGQSSCVMFYKKSH